MKYQIVSYTKDGFIIRHKTFTDHEYDEMIAYIAHESQLKEVNRVEITRWNIKGEKV